MPMRGVERKEIGQEESGQIEYFPGQFERIHHGRKKLRLCCLRD